MDHLFDEISRSLAETVPRRESLRRLGAVFTGAVLSPLGLETVWAGQRDPCQAFCRCRNAKQQSQCLATCKTCKGNTGRLAGSCGGYTCCSIASCKGACSNLKSDPNCGACGNNCSADGRTCCGNYCADLNNDVFNCGQCGTVCPAPGPYEHVACVAGQCAYECDEGADDCQVTCTYLAWDPDNCGACGNVCPDSAPICYRGACSPCDSGLALCGDSCVGLRSDPDNCGACGNVCGGSTPYCSGGACTDCVGAGGAICDGVCIDIWSDPFHCGACGNICPAGEPCNSGVCGYWSNPDPGGGGF